MKNESEKKNKKYLINRFFIEYTEKWYVEYIELYIVSKLILLFNFDF